ncbi:MAG: exo-alpha-sialidase [bacterium]
MLRLALIAVVFATPVSAELVFSDPVRCADQTSEWWQGSPAGRIGSRNELYAAWVHTGFGSGDGGIYFARSLDTNRTWSSDITIHFWDPTWIHCVYTSPVLEEFRDTLYCFYWLKPEGTDDRHLYASRSDDRGESWNIFETSISAAASGTPEGQSFVVRPGGVVDLAFASRFGMSRPRSYHCRSTNGGVTFSTPAPLPGDPSSVSVDDPSIAVAPGGVLLVATGHVSQAGSWIVVNRSTDNGATWDTLSLRAQLGDGSRPSLRATGSDRLYLLWQGASNGEVRFARSDDLGATWSTPFTVVGSTWAYGVFADRDGRVIVLWGDDGSWDSYHRSSSDGGESWSASARVWPTSPFPGDWLVYRPHIRNDLTAFWMHPEPGNVEATYCSHADWPTGVAEPVTMVGPAATALTATPSVCHGRTVFRAPDRRPVAVAIHDAAGRLVRALAPSADATWDGADAWGQRLPAGIYFGRAEGLLPARVVLTGR